MTDSTIQLEAYSAQLKKQKIYCVGEASNLDSMYHSLFNIYSEENLRRHRTVVIFTDVFLKHQPKFLKNTYIDAIFRIRDNNDLRLAYTFIQHTAKPLIVLWYGNDIPVQIFSSDLTLITGGLYPKYEYSSLFFSPKVSSDEANMILHNKMKDVDIKGILSELKASEVSLVWHSSEMSDKRGSLYWFDFTSVKSTIPIINYHQAVEYLRNLADALELKEV
jgi:hypothetical protein